MGDYKVIALYSYIVSYMVVINHITMVRLNLTNKI
jgi:hypothetical protein